jgi:hypothetical protein
MLLIGLLSSIVYMIFSHGAGSGRHWHAIDLPPLYPSLGFLSPGVFSSSDV